MDVSSSPTAVLASTDVEPSQSGRIRISGGPISSIEAVHRDSLAPATHFLHEWAEYVVTCEGADWLEVGSQHIPSFGAGSGMFRVQFANQTGLSSIRAFDVAGHRLDIQHVEVISPKLGGPETSLEFLRALLADLTSERGAMAFMPRSSTSRTVKPVHRPPSLLVQYFFLLTNAEGIQAALHQVLRSPHRVLDDDTEHVSIFDLTDIDADVVLQLVQGGARFDLSQERPRPTSAPQGVWFRVPREGFDSAENQFVKAITHAMADTCDDVLRASWLQDRAAPSTAQRRDALSQLRNRLRQFTRAPMFDEVGTMSRIPASSRVLQRRAGYRDLNEHWQGFLQAHDPAWQRMQLAIDLRDIATLYEYWVWFELCRRIADALGGERPSISSIPPSESGLPHGLKAQFGDSGTLTYNASRRAYSGIFLRPDYLWEPATGRKVGFDAKFRLAKDAAPLDVEDGAAPKDPQVRAKADDLVKMHAYRDAIPGLGCALVLYPGNVADFRPVSGPRRAGIDIGDVLHGELDGVGAIPMMPEGVEW